MAQKYITVKTSDLSGAELLGDEGETITFSVGRSSYVIDLTNDEVGAFYDVLQPYTDAARTAEGSSAPKSSSGVRTAKRGDLVAVRAWANENGHEVSARGRVAQSVLDAYDAAN